MGLYTQTQVSGHIPERHDAKKEKDRYNFSPFDVLPFTRTRQGTERAKLEEHFISYKYTRNSYHIAELSGKYIATELNKNQLLDFIYDKYPSYLL